jgi:hypothetical protein
MLVPLLYSLLDRDTQLVSLSAQRDVERQPTPRELQAFGALPASTVPFSSMSAAIYLLQRVVVNADDFRFVRNLLRKTTPGPVSPGVANLLSVSGQQDTGSCVINLAKLRTETIKSRVHLHRVLSHQGIFQNTGLVHFILHIQSV